MKKLILMTIVLFLGSYLMFSQDLVEAAKKEKERRARLKKKSVIVVTNADLENKQKEEVLTTSRPESKAQNTQRTVPSQLPSPRSTQPSGQIDNIDQMDIRVDKSDQLDQLQARGFRSDYATQVLNSNGLVKNPELALDKPDGRFAEIPRLGFIDLQISVENGPGDDIAVYALHAGAESVASGGEEEGGIPQIVADFYGEGLWYGVLGMGKNGDWVAIGKGSGTVSPERFDLGDLSSINRIRIMFSQFNDANFPIKLNRTQANDSTFKIDAVESLHR